METQAAINYNRIADAIAFYKANFKDQPSLEQVAEHVHLSPFHFQRMFKEWAGVTPKQFLQYLTLEHAKQVLGSGATLSDAAFEAGLSGTGRLHDLFIKINAAVVAALNEPQVKDQFVSIGFELVGNTPAQFAAYQQQEFARWKKVIETRKISIE